MFGLAKLFHAYRILERDICRERMRRRSQRAAYLCDRAAWEDERRRLQDVILKKSGASGIIPRQSFMADEPLGRTRAVGVTQARARTDAETVRSEILRDGQPLVSEAKKQSIIDDAVRRGLIGKGT